MPLTTGMAKQLNRAIQPRQSQADAVKASFDNTAEGESEENPYRLKPRAPKNLSGPISMQAMRRFLEGIKAQFGVTSDEEALSMLQRQMRQMPQSGASDMPFPKDRGPDSQSEIGQRKVVPGGQGLTQAPMGGSDVNMA